MADCCNHFKFTDDGDSFQSWQGLRGPYYIPHISADGVLSWTNTGSLPNPAPVDISGPPGSSVELRGPVPSVEDLPATASSSELWLVGTASPYDGWFYNGTSWENAGQIAVGPTGPQGPAGQDGTDGSNGVTFTPTVSSAGVISWTNDGSLPNPDPVDIKGPQGETGAAGSDGSDGVTFTPSVSSAGVISWTNDGGLPNPESVNIKGPQGETGQTGPAGQDGTDGSNGATFTPSVSSAGVISWTNDGGLPNPESVNIKGPQGQTGQTGPAGPGVPTGGTAGQVLTKTGAADYATGWQDPSGGDVTADMLGIVIDGNSTPVGASIGQYVIVTDSTISGISDGLYTARQTIPANTAIDSTYLTAVSEGGLNDLSKVEDVTSYLSNINTTYLDSVSAKKAGHLVIINFATKIVHTIPDSTKLFDIGAEIRGSGSALPAVSTLGHLLGAFMNWGSYVNFRGSFNEDARFYESFTYLI